MINDAEISEWCASALGSAPKSQLFETGHLSRVLGYRLKDGRDIVVKVRDWQPRLDACHRVHQHMFKAGFPCPEPLAGPMRLGKFAINAETVVIGSQHRTSGDVAAVFAQPLADFVSLAPSADQVGDLSPSPPWVAWDHLGPVLWPAPDDRPGDLNAVDGSPWLDDLAHAVRERMKQYHAPTVVGHGDWYSQNLLWENERFVAALDWDSIVAQPEAAIVGQASIAWPVTGAPAEVATLKQSEDFIAGYLAASCRSFAEHDHEAAWAAGLWQRAFDAKKALLAGEDPDAILSLSEATDRALRAGLHWPTKSIQ
jgi:Phosphotransferase enzyme family